VPPTTTTPSDMPFAPPLAMNAATLPGNADGRAVALNDATRQARIPG